MARRSWMLRFAWALGLRSPSIAPAKRNMYLPVVPTGCRVRVAEDELMFTRPENAFVIRLFPSSSVPERFLYSFLTRELTSFRAASTAPGRPIPYTTYRDSATVRTCGMNHGPPRFTGFPGAYELRTNRRNVCQAIRGIGTNLPPFLPSCEQAWETNVSPQVR